LILGAIAIATPFVTGVAVSVYIGILVAAAGILRIAHAFKSRQWGVGIWGTVVGVLMVLAGIALFARPVFGLATLTLVLAIYLLIEGFSEIIVAFKMKPDQGWVWMLFGGTVALLLGFMIWRQMPLSGAWAIGTLLGIHIVMTGWQMIILGTGARSLTGAIEDAVEDTAEYAEGVADRATDLAEGAVDRAKDLADGAVDAAGDMVDKARDVFDGDRK
jgi:uncharacterized membrane protein HdeD (DUF308 family)